MGVGTPRLLVVDDEEQIRSMLNEHFTDEGYRVVTARDAPTALRLLPTGFDVVISDIRMPGMTGIDFLKSVREINPGLGVFLITGFPMFETLIEAKAYRAQAYFQKPIDLEAIGARIRAFLEAPAHSAHETSA